MTADNCGPTITLHVETNIIATTKPIVQCSSNLALLHEKNITNTTPANLPFPPAAAETKAAANDVRELSPMSAASTTTIATTTTFSDVYDHVSLSLQNSCSSTSSSSTTIDYFDFAAEKLDLSYSWDAPVWIDAWRIGLAVAAFLDVAAAAAAAIYETDGSTAVFQYETNVFRLQQQDGDDDQWNAVRLCRSYWGWCAVVRWLQSHATLFGFIFSSLWLADAFVTAHERREQALRQEESKILLNEDDEEIIKNGGHRICGAWGIYYRTIALQILLLPVGFFVFSFGLMRHVQNRQVRAHEQVFQVVHNGEHSVHYYEAFDANSKPSLLLVVIKHVTIMISLRTGSHVRQRILQKMKQITRNLVIHAIRNPIRFIRMAGKALRWIRWARYLAPLLGTLNKLKGNFSDLLKKIKQARDAKKAKVVRMKLWDQLTEDELKEYCAMLIQSTFRSKRSRKCLHALNIIRGETETIAALKVQKIFRRNLRRARARLKRKKIELQLLEERDQEARKKSNIAISFSERKRMYQLRQELKYETKKLLNESLLLRPNTKFAVAWRTFFVFAVLLEIVQLAYQPHFQKYKQLHSEGQVSIEIVLLATLTPSTPVWERPECAVPRKTSGLPLLKLLRTLWQRLVRRRVPSKPWYCKDFYAKAQYAYIAGVATFLHVFFVIMGIVTFLDVFITFFIGEYNSETGVLQPRAFVDRWIIPGLLLQLLVNPQMQSTSKILGRLLIAVVHTGPVRVLRWTNALFFPASIIIQQSIKKFWIKLVRDQNRNGILKRFRTS